MRTLSIVAVVILLLSALCVPGFIGHFKQVPRDIGSAIDSNVPRSHLEGMVESDFNKAEQDLRQRYIELFKVRSKVAELESAVKVQKDELQKKEQMLQRAKDLLAKSKAGSMVTVANVQFSWEQINQDALNQLGACKVLRKQMEGNEQSLSKLRQAHEQGIRVIADKQEELRRAKTDFDVQKAELSALLAQEEVNALIGNINQVTDVKTDLGAARKAYEDRLKELRASAEYNQQMSVSQSETTIPWDKEIGVTEKATESIQSYFDGKAQPKK